MAEQPHPYRCEICYNRNCYISRLYDGDRDDPDGEISKQEAWKWTSLRGCASHSDAVAADRRIEDVIKGLETRIYNIERARKENSQLTGGHLAVQLYKDTISLLRNGVGQK